MKFVAIPIKVLEDIGSNESRKYIIDRLVYAHTAMNRQADHIAELEQKIDDLEKALGVLQQNKCKVKAVKPVSKKNKRLKKLEIIVRENNDAPYEFPATVGVKCYINGRKPYGLYSGFGKPELTVAEVVDTANLLIEDILGRWKDGRL